MKNSSSALSMKSDEEEEAMEAGIQKNILSIVCEVSHAGTYQNGQSLIMLE